MAKFDYIEKIEGYLNDGLVRVPISARRGLEADGVGIDDFKDRILILKNALDSLQLSEMLSLMPERLLADIVGSIESMRAESRQLTRPDNLADSAFANIVHQVETLIQLVVPYLNLSDSQDYKSLAKKVSDTLSSSQKRLSEGSRAIKRQSDMLDSIQEKSSNILRGVSTGALSKNFGELNESWWNRGLLIGSGLLAATGFGLFWWKTAEISGYLVDGLSGGTVNLGVFFAKWLVTLPFLLMLTIGLFELRNRIKYRDIFDFRRNVAGSLEGYTETLLNKVEDIKDVKEKDVARGRVIQFMIDSMIELTKPPTITHDKHSLGVKVRDIGEANINTNPS